MKLLKFEIFQLVYRDF